MRFFVKLTPKAGKQRSDFAPLIVEEQGLVWTLYAAGTIRELGFQPEPATFCLTFEQESRAAVEDQVASLPMVRAGLLDVEIIELHPWTQFQVLFRPDALDSPR